MRILYCNKYNYAFSGTEVYLFEVMELMRSQGHEVALFSMADPKGDPTPYDRHFVPHIDFKEKTGLWKKMRRAGHAVYSTEARRRIRAMIKEFRPDVAHVRNIYHHLSPSILWELKAQRVPVLYHLNDFKLLCPSYNLVSHGKACEACKGGEFWHELKERCYPGAGARITLMMEAYVHRWLGTYRKCVDLFLAPSQFVRDKFVEHGWDGKKFEVLQHFQKIHPVARTGTDGPLLYFGRLSEEKGVDDLLRSMQQVPQMRLIVAGEGPQRVQLQELAASLRLRNVEFVGHVGKAQRDALIAQSQFTVLPSHAYETLGKTILESYSEGRAVVASDMGSRRELVQEGETGMLYRTGDVDQLARQIAVMGDNPELTARMGRAGREFVRTRHTPEGHYQKLMMLYARLVAGNMNDGVIAGTDCTAPAQVRHTATAVKAATAMSAASPKRKLSVAFIGGRGVISKYSGIEAYYEEVGKCLAEMGHEVTIYCRSYFTPAQAEYNGMRLIRLPTIRSKHLETLVHTLLSTAHVMTTRCDVVHYHALGPALFSFLPRLMGKKTAVTVQGLDWQRKKWGRVASAVLQLGEHASVTLPNSTMVVSQTLRQRYRNVHGIEPTYVPNGGVLREAQPPRKILEWGLEPGNYVLFLGRFSPEKGCHLLIEAFEQLDTNVKLVLAGASSYCDDYGRALLDAMGAGLCVLTSDVPENREVIDGAGFTFERGNSTDLADRLRFLIANPGAREAAGKAAKARIREHYQWQSIAAEIEKTYFDLVGWTASAVPKKPSARVTAVSNAEGMGRRVG